MFRVYTTSVKKYTARRKIPDGLHYTVYFVGWFIKYFNQKYKKMRNSTLPHTLNSFNSFSAIEQFCPSLYNNHEQSHTQWSVPQQAPQVQYTYITCEFRDTSAVCDTDITSVEIRWRLSATRHSMMSRYPVASDRRESVFVVSSSVLEFPFWTKGGVVSWANIIELLSTAYLKCFSVCELHKTYYILPTKCIYVFCMILWFSGKILLLRFNSMLKYTLPWA